MKKLLIAGAVILSFTAVSFFTGASSETTVNGQSVYAAVNNDTTPKKKDTTQLYALNDTTPKKKDTTLFAYNRLSNDTTPKKKDTTLFAYNNASIDTTPKKKDTTMFAYVAANDTTPKKKDTTMAFVAMR